MARRWALLLRLVAVTWQRTHVEAQSEAAGICARLDAEQSHIWESQDNPNEPPGRRGMQFSYRFVVPHWWAPARLLRTKRWRSHARRLHSARCVPQV